MTLIDRYIHEVGRFLPRKNKGDIQAELRSSVVDTMEDRFGPEPSETEVEELLKEFGPPREVAGSYFPQGQYLVGPGLYPLFRMVAWIVIAAVLGAQMIAWGIGVLVAGEPFSALEILASVVNSIPASLGWVLITFMILQYFDAKPALDEEPWEPKALPAINPDQDLKRVEIIIGLVGGLLILFLVTLFPQWVGFITFPGGKYYPNPVILQYLTLIKISLGTAIALNVYLLWKGRWNMVTRMIKIALDIFGVVILAFLVDGHNAWLAAQSAGGFFDAIEAISEIAEGGWELVGMHAFRLAFVVALIVTVIEILAAIFRLIKSNLKSDFSPKDFVLKVD
ncbi:MAG: hypothetical protein MUO54_08775 [Anaerolineales bacterium]|nr:hypothetical protein [Anaerolineales bacterium]